MIGMMGFDGTVRRARRLALAAGMAGLAVLAAGCGLLDVSDPTLLEEDELQNSTSATMLRAEVIQRLAFAVANGAKSSGFFSDELYADPNQSSVLAGVLTPEDAMDRRESVRLEPLLASFDNPYPMWHETRRAASTALPFIRGFTLEPARSAAETQLLAIRGFATLALAEQFCPGFPLNDVKDGVFIRTAPTTTSEAFERAIADFDSALAITTDSTRYTNFAKIGKARALLGLGRITEAGAAVTGIPTEFEYTIDYSSDAGQRNDFEYLSYGTRFSVADQEGGNGLDYVTARDPRVVVTPQGLDYSGVDSVYGVAKYASADASMMLASGIEARLIEAEAALASGGDWRGILNGLRDDYPALALGDVDDPGTDAARQDLLFRERAFWLFATGHRLGDMRRLVAHYSRTAESVFPTGFYRLGGAYATATSIAFPGAEEHADNPAVMGCTSR